MTLRTILSFVALSNNCLLAIFSNSCFKTHLNKLIRYVIPRFPVWLLTLLCPVRLRILSKLSSLCVPEVSIAFFKIISIFFSYTFLKTISLLTCPMVFSPSLCRTIFLLSGISSSHVMRLSSIMYIWPLVFENTRLLRQVTTPYCRSLLWGICVYSTPTGPTCGLWMLNKHRMNN